MTVHREHRPTPLAQGSFAEKPFPHILVYLLQKKLGGTLEVHCGDGHNVSIYFRDGMPGKVRSSLRGKELGQVLLDMGLISEAALRESRREMAETGAFQGQILIRMGAIDAAGMVRGLRTQMLLKLVDVFAMNDAAFAFFNHVNLLVGSGPDEVIPIDPYPVLMAGVRAHAEKLPVDGVLQAIDGRWISFLSVDALRRFRLTPAEKQACMPLLERPRTFAELADRGDVPTADLRAVLYVALITKELALHEMKPAEAGRPSAPPPAGSRLDSAPPPPSAPAQLSPEAAAQRTRILSKAAQISNENYFQMLELPLGAPVEEARRAFFKLAKIFHPDRAIGELADLKETCEYIFSNLSEAHSTLVDPDARDEYAAAISEGIKRTSVAPPGAAEAEVREALEAENQFQKALVLMRRGQIDKALELVDAARRMNPEEGEYLGLWAKLQLQKRGADAPVSDVVEQLRHAEELSPKSERIQLFLAQALLRQGNASEARTHFENVVQANPHNVEAARELHLMEIRRAKAKAKPEKKDLLQSFRSLLKK